MNAFSAITWLQKYPGLLTLIGRMPSLKDGTAKLLLKFLERAVEQNDPEDFIVAAIEAALKAPIPTKVEVISVTRTLPK